jgi:hypothetical protein
MLWRLLVVITRCVTVLDVDIGSGIHAGVGVLDLVD